MKAKSMKLTILKILGGLSFVAYLLVFQNCSNSVNIMRTKGGEQLASKDPVGGGDPATAQRCDLFCQMIIDD